MSSRFRPIRRFTLEIVRVGFVAAWRRAISPTTTSPFSRNATTEGVLLLPSLLGITTGSEPIVIATTEFVVPRSIPRMFDSEFMDRPPADCVSTPLFPVPP